MFSVSSDRESTATSRLPCSSSTRIVQDSAAAADSVAQNTLKRGGMLAQQTKPGSQPASQPASHLMDSKREAATDAAYALRVDLLVR